GPGRTAAVVNLGADRSSAFFTYRSADPEAELARGPVDALTTAFAGLGGGAAGALRRLAGAREGPRRDSVTQAARARGSRGRVVLACDRAWRVSPSARHRAARRLGGPDPVGAGLEDQGGDVPAALGRWEAGLRTRSRDRQAA